MLVMQLSHPTLILLFVCLYLACSRLHFGFYLAVGFPCAIIFSLNEKL